MIGRPIAWARRWHADGLEPQKERNANGRMAWPAKFKLYPVTHGKCCADDVALYTAANTLKILVKIFSQQLTK
jgi:hypothetical protein